MPFGTIHQIIPMYKTIVITINKDSRRQNDLYETPLVLVLPLSIWAWLGNIAGGIYTLTVVKSN